MAGYTRQSTFADGDTITAALFNNEFNQLLNAFGNTSGHKHDGTANEGPVIGLIGDAGETSPNNKVLIDTTNNYIEFYVEVSSAPVQQLYIADGAIIPVTDSDIDLGTTSLRFKDTYTDTITTTGNATIGGDLTVTGSATISGNLTFGDADTDSINLAAEIDSDIIPNTDGTYDLGSATKEWQDLYIDGTANIDSLVADTADINGGTIDGATIATSDITVGAGKTLDVSSGTLTLADDQISGDKVEGGTIAATTITSLTATSADINGGTIDGVTIGGTTAGAVTFTDLSDGTITVTAFADEDDMSSDSATLVPTQQSVKAYVDSQVTAQDLDVTTDSGTIAIDLDSETLTVTGGTGLDSSATGNAVTLAIDSTVTTLTGSQTLTNKTLTTPIISSISNTGTLTLPTSTDTLVGRATTDTLTNKTLTSPTLTSPVINTGVSGTAFLDDDTFATATASTLASSESIKAYVDTTVAATNEVVEDTTPQLGGDLDLNSNDITGTGNINITGTIQSSGNITGTLATAAQPNITSLGTLTALTGGTGDLNWDSGTLFVDSSANSVGIGTSSPDGKVHIFSSSAGTVTAANDANDLVLESSTNVGMTLLTGNSSVARIRFGDADSNARGNIFYNHNSDSFGFQTAGSTKLTLTQDGELGVGTTNPADLLDVRGDGADTYIRVGSDTASGNDAAKIGKIDSSTDFVIQASAGTTSSNTIFKRNTTAETVRIDSSGNVGIGTSSPSSKLDVAGNIGSSGTISSTSVLNCNGSGSTDSQVNIGVGRNANGYAFLDLIGDATYTDYGLRIIRNNSGANTTSVIQHRGTGTLGLLTQEAAAIQFSTNGSERMRIDSSGNVGIGTASPVGKLSISDSGATGVEFSPDDSNARVQQLYYDRVDNAYRTSLLDAGDYQFRISGSEAMRIDSSGNVGIGTSSPQAPLHARNGSSGVSSYTAGTRAIIEGTATTYLTIAAPNTSLSGILFADPDDSDNGFIKYDHSSSGVMSFGAAAAERMRIDNAGNLLVGKTATGLGNQGAELSSTGQLKGTAPNQVVAYLNRTSSDGSIAEFRKDNSAVGSIGTAGSALVLGNGNAGFYFNSSLSTVMPWSITNNTNSDAAIDIGQSANRFKDLYLSGGAYLGGTGAANKLDDYEEGTWTPASATTGITIQGTASGTYTKIGRIVYYTISLKCNKTGSGSSQVVFSGLPFSGTGGILQFTRFEPTGIAYQWINGSTSGTSVYLTRPAGTAPGSSGGTNNNDGQVLKVDDISTTTNSALQNVSAYGWYSV